LKENTVVNRSILMTIAAAVAGASMLQAQSIAPLISEEKAAYQTIQKNLLAAAEKMPEADYSFKPTPEIRTFGQLMAHTAGAAIRMCSRVKGGEAPQVDMTKSDKASVVEMFKTATAQCDAAWEAMNEKTALETLPGRGGSQVTKLSMLIGYSVVHNNEEYGYAAVYMRLKNIVPPSSAR
jgi:uncharacterized damage-inducible protein DinB